MVELGCFYHFILCIAVHVDECISVNFDISSNSHMTQQELV